MAKNGHGSLQYQDATQPVDAEADTGKVVRDDFAPDKEPTSPDRDTIINNEILHRMLGTLSTQIQGFAAKVGGMSRYLKWLSWAVFALAGSVVILAGLWLWSR